jgi:hypothetical protein
VNVRSSMTGAIRPVSAPSTAGTRTQHPKIRASRRSARQSRTAPAAIATSAAKRSVGWATARPPKVWTMAERLVDGIQLEWPPWDWTRKDGPQSTAHPSTAAARARRHRQASRSLRHPARSMSPAPSRNIETCVSSPRNVSTPIAGACHDRGRRNHESASTAAATPTISSSAYMRASRPCASWNALSASRPVATIPAAPRFRIHHAKSANAPTEQTTDGNRNRSSSTPARARGARSR